MSALTEYLYPLPARRSPTSIIAWWERRRLGFNLLVGGAGLVSLAAVYGFTALIGAPIEFLGGPVLVFGILANLYYTLGWVLEVGVNAVWAGEVGPIGPALSRAGLIFSVGLALLPVLIMPVVLLIWVTGVVL